jgi:Kef-type K+ transport system membrane component KefB
MLGRLGPRDFFVLGLIAVAAIADDRRTSENEAIVTVVWAVALGAAIAMMIWDRGRRTELDRLIFYKATTLAFVVTLVVCFVSAVLQAADVVKGLSLRELPLLSILAWQFGLGLFRRRST